MVTDTTAGTSTAIDFAYVANAGSSTTNCATWDFAPLDQMQEAGDLDTFRTRLHQDDSKKAVGFGFDFSSYPRYILKSIYYFWCIVERSWVSIG